MKTHFRPTTSTLVIIGLTATSAALAASPGAAPGGQADNQPPVTAQQPTDVDATSAAAIIQKMAAHYSSLSSLKVNISCGISALSMNGKKFLIPRRETLALQRPGMVAYREYNSAALPGTSAEQPLSNVSSDGRNTIVYEKTMKRYTNQPATTLAVMSAKYASDASSWWGPTTMMLLTLFTDSPMGNSTRRLIGSSHLAGRKMLNGESVDILAFPSFGSGYFSFQTPRASKYFLAVDAKRGLLVRATAILGGGSGVTVTEDIHPLSENTLLPASLFTFHPPSDARLIDRF